MFTSALVLLLTFGSLTLVVDATGPTVDTGYATYLGNHSLPNTAAFLGIPYAEPPLGKGRFRPPAPLNTTRLKQNTAIVDATDYPAFCIQGTTGNGDAGGAGSEDCLKVNIYTPINSTKHSKLPVLVYIHGGGYIFGNPANWPFDHWVNQSPNVVIVSVYYRLTIFGFLSHPALSDPALGSLNVGFLDQIQALRWVKEYIADFGGNPGKMTINGESAGGSSVELHLIAHEGKNPLFTGAIAQSVFRVGLLTPEQQIPLFNYLLHNTSCTLNTISAQMSCLRNASVSALIRSADSACRFFSGPYCGWIPVVDKKVITGLPTRLILDGKWAKVPLIAGATSNETLSSGKDIARDLKGFFPQLTDDDIQQFLDMYPQSDFLSTRERNDTITGEPEVRCGRELLAGTASESKLPAFAYRYNQPNPTGRDVVHVEHAAENWMMFLGTNTGPNGSTVFTGLNPVQTAFSEELIAYWLSFVRSSNPNTYKLARSPVWPPFSLAAAPPHEGHRQVLQQEPNNDTTRSGVRSEGEPQVEVQRCKFAFSKATVMEN